MINQSNLFFCLITDDYKNYNKFCRDLCTDCEYLKSIDECKTKVAWMTGNCKKTCGKCIGQ